MTFKWSILFLIISLSANAQPTKLSFDAAAFAGRSVHISVMLDPISKRDSTLQISPADKNGVAPFSIKIKEIGSYQLNVDRFSAPIFLEPGGDYQLALIDKPTNALVSTGQPGSFEYAFIGLDSMDINAAIVDFDQWYFQTQIEFVKKRRLSVLEQTCEAALPKWLARHPSSFFHTYIQYSMAELLLNAGANRQNLYTAYFSKMKLSIENPAWFAFFNNYYGNYFQGFDTRFGGQTIYNRMKAGISPDTLDYIIAKMDTTLVQPELRHLVSLQSIGQNYTDRNYPIVGMMDWISYIKSQSTSPVIKGIAENLALKLRATIIGQPLDSVIPEFKPVRARMADLPVYVFITEAGQMVSDKEIIRLESLLSQYADFFQVVEVSVGGTKKSKNKPWPIIEANDRNRLMSDLNIYGLPYSLWISPEGIILENGTIIPSEGLEKRLYKIQSDWREADQIKVGN